MGSVASEAFAVRMSIAERIEYPTNGDENLFADALCSLGLIGLAVEVRRAASVSMITRTASACC